MIKIELTDEEREVLREIIETNLTDLRVEIVSTERLEFKDALKRRKVILNRILEALEHSENVVHPAW